MEQVNGKALVCRNQNLWRFHEAKPLSFLGATSIPPNAPPALSISGSKGLPGLPEEPPGQINPAPRVCSKWRAPIDTSWFALCASLQNILESDLSRFEFHSWL